MFQSKKYIASRHGQSSPNRYEYLQQLAHEYTSTNDIEAKQQVLANLANFAYDPGNYDWLWDINVVDLFLDALDNDDILLQEFGLGGLANICLEPRHQYYIVSDPKYIKAISRYICSRPNNATNNTILNALTTLLLLLNSQTQEVILTEELKQGLIQLRTDVKYTTISRMAGLFLHDYYQE
ncbi:uncharacterized protein BX664DRAFT_340282 [Halteromyces radiatus]|uniref:uncharacterized protein n=1 Tax=Halteromyces radiatus TaxID=101107 RepID=UPI00221FF28C|nr:uncharacterized protein BX664DRAFT_340282 [Halteromyces radiatus]KAI8081387.1 hypothetical protein BX664DRAFT_340282 [Halteromyces radiatus]